MYRHGVRGTHDGPGSHHEHSDDGDEKDRFVQAASCARTSCRAGRCRERQGVRAVACSSRSRGVVARGAAVGCLAARRALPLPARKRPAPVPFVGAFPWPHSSSDPFKKKNSSGLSVARRPGKAQGSSQPAPAPALLASARHARFYPPGICCQRQSWTATRASSRPCTVADWWGLTVARDRPIDRSKRSRGPALLVEGNG